MTSPRRVPPEVVQRIYVMRTDGMTAVQIAKALTSEGVPTAHGGAAWHPATISSIARGPRPAPRPARGVQAPECFDSVQDYLKWREASRAWTGYCSGCSSAYRAEMTEQGRCFPPAGEWRPALPSQQPRRAIERDKEVV